MNRPESVPCLIFLLLALCSCAQEPIQLLTRDNDDFDIPEPAKNDEGDYIWADGAYLMSMYQAKKMLSPGWALRKVGVLAEVEAENVNSLDAIPDSTWFTNRHGLQRVSAEELVRGPGHQPPNGNWTVVAGKQIGRNPGFIAQHEDGRLLFVKFDPGNFPGMGTNGDVIVSKFLHSAGYNVPEYYAVRLSRDALELSPTAEIPGQYGAKRPMTEVDLAALLDAAPQLGDGTVLANVSIGIPGKVKGPFEFFGTRDDDPNDTVLHENRRELRGLGLFMAWFNNTDQRRGNTLDTYVEENGRRFLRHYILDFSGSFGSLNDLPKLSANGHEYAIDPEMIFRSAIGLGVWVRRWESVTAPTFSSVGYFESDSFDPETWRSIYPNPAFEKITERDAYWATKIITSFTDKDIRRIVATGFFPEPAQQEYVVRQIILRRNIIGRRFLNHSRISPLDRFSVQLRADHKPQLQFDDLAVERGYADQSKTRYRYRVNDGDFVEMDSLALELPHGYEGQQIEIQTSRHGDNDWGPSVSVWITRRDGEPKVVRIDR